MKDRNYQPETQKILEDIENKYLEYFNCDENSEELIWHYTDQNGLIGVIKKGTVRASHAYYLNDFREITHGKTLILEWYKSKKDKIKSKDTLTYEMV